MNDRQLAQKWPFLRHNLFEKELQTAASKKNVKNNLPDKQSNFLFYTGNDGKVNVEVFLKDETVWLTQTPTRGIFGGIFGTLLNYST